MKPELNKYIQQLAEGIATIPSTRLELLNALADYIDSKRSEGKPVNLTFICTHNSRRSHLSQIWATVLAHYFKIGNLNTYSGGTEVTIFNIRAVNALHRAGFGVINPGGANSKYEVHYDQNTGPLICYSKVYDSPENPNKDFAAVMTCSQADEACPIVLGADVRFSLYYEDPKEADDTPWEAERYEERLKQIGIEIYYLMNRVASK